MAAEEPKVTKLKPGEGAGDTPVARRGARGQELRSRCIQSDGSVNPECKEVYQRSVAGRQKAEDFVKSLDSQGVSEKEIFLATVKKLMSRGLGYVGAYLDAKNPERRYDRNEAMAVADRVMSKANVGENPGRRLSKESDEAKERRKGVQKEAKESGATFEPGARAMPLRQQRRQPGGRGPGLGPLPEGTEKEVKEAPLTTSQKIRKSLEEKPEPTISQQEELDALMAAREKMDPEEWQNSLGDLLNRVQEGGGRQREILREYLSDLRAGIGTKKLPLPGSSAAALRDSKIAKDKEAEQKRQEKVQAKAAAGRKKTRKEPSEGSLESRISSELERGGLGGKLETSREDWLKDDDDDEDTEYIPPKTTSARGEIPREMQQILSNELKSQLDVQARLNLKLPYDLNRKVQQRILDPNKLNKLNQEIQRLKKDPDQLDYLIDEAISEVKRVQGIEDDSSDELAKEFLMSSVSDKKPQVGANRPINPPQIKTPEDRQSKSTDEDVMRRAVGLVPKKGAETPQASPSPESEAQPTPQEPPTEPQQKAPKRKGGFRAPAQARPKGGGVGFTPTPKVVQDVKAAAAQANSLEDFKSYLYNNQPNLFGGAGFETGPSPLEEPEPDQYSRFRGSPAPEPEGAQEAGREEKGGSLFVSPQTAKKRGVKSTIESESGKIENPELYTSPRTGPGYGPAGSQQKREIAEKKEAKNEKYKGMTDEEKKAEVLRLVKEEGMSIGKARNLVGVKPKPSRKPRKQKVSNNAEYQEFAQSIRSMLR